MHLKIIKAALVIAVILNFLTQAAPADPALGEHLSISVTNRHGDVFTNLVVAKVLGDGLVLEHPAGELRVKYGDLPKEIREKYQALGAAAESKQKEDAEANSAFAASQRRAQAEQAAVRAAREKKEAAQALAVTSKLRIEIPNQGWGITVMNPGLRELGRQQNDTQFVYQAIGRNGFNVSIFVEKPEAGGMENSDVFNFYWTKASRNPLIDQKSIRAQVKGNFVKVFYASGGIPNTNYYFAFNGRWVDVHISKFPFTRADEKLFAEFEEILSYGG